MTLSRPLGLVSRELLILADLDRVRLLTGSQLERLQFVGLTTTEARGSARRRTMGRLVSLGLVTTLPRRVGGERAGSAGLIYTLDVGGHRWLSDPALANGAVRIRRPWSIGWSFVNHTLDVSELYVRLREQERAGQVRLDGFLSEPASWHHWSGGQLKPDAYATWTTLDWEESCWIEVDRATESIPTLRKKLLGYVTFANSPGAGPVGVAPAVVVTVPDERRRLAVQTLIGDLPKPAGALISVSLHQNLFTTAGEARPPP